MLDRNSMTALRRQLAARRIDEGGPLRWYEFLNVLSREWTGRDAMSVDWRRIWQRQDALFSWHLSPETISAAMMGRGLVYLCWGLSGRNGWKGRMERLVLSRAEHVLVNDRTTQKEIADLTGRVAPLVPFFIDTGYFSFRPYAGRENFLFCNGINDRDPEILVQLAQGGFRVVWLVNDEELWQRYADRHQNLQLVKNISFAQLRTYYQTCAAVVTPALRDRHAAGQTTGSEAIACGAPLVITQGRTSTIFAGLPSVLTIAAEDAGSWTGAVMGYLRRADLAGDCDLSARLIRNRISLAGVGNALKPYFQSRSTRVQGYGTEVQ